MLNMESGRLQQPYTETTNGIRVTVIPEYLPDESEPEREQFGFAYTVTIENGSPSTVQLLRRHWVVFSGGNFLTEVKGDGVVGMQPVLSPGDVFRYSSGSVITDPVGAMQGSYAFVDEQGNPLDVTIPHFDLVCPDFLH